MASVKITAQKTASTAGVSATVVVFAQLAVKFLQNHGVEMDDTTAVVVITAIASGLHSAWAGAFNIYKHWIAKK
jgi:hypothetical protein